MRSPNSWKEVHPEEDKLPPRKPLSHRTLVEMYVGRQGIAMLRLRDTMPPRDYEKFCAWVSSRVEPRQ